MKGIIIGAGIGGLATAVALQQAGIDFEIMEAAPELKPVGAGIVMASNAMQVFQRLGMEQDIISAGQEVARLDEIPLYAPIDGMLRGLTHDGVPVAQKTKIIEVDPRGQQAQISGIPERPRRIAAGVLLAIKIWQASK